MKLRLDPDAAQALRGMAPVSRRRMKEALAKASVDPAGRTVGLDVKQLAINAPWPAFRLVVGDWRAAWFIRAGTVQVLRIFHRSEGYAWLERLYPQAPTSRKGSMGYIRTTPPAS